MSNPITPQQNKYLAAMANNLPSAKVLVGDRTIAYMTKAEAATVIAEIITGMTVFGGKSVLTRENIVADHLRAAQGSVATAWVSIRPLVGVTPEMVFSANVNGARTAKGRYQQLDEAQKLVAKIRAKYPRDFWTTGVMPGAAVNVAAPAPVTVTPPVITTSTRAAVAEMRNVVRHARAFAKDRKLASLESMRFTIDATRAILAGAPVAALTTSLTASWSVETRTQFTAWMAGRPMITERERNVFEAEGNGDVHCTAPYVLALVKAGVNVYLHGPAGTSKSSVAKHAAEALGMDYREVNLAGSMASAIKGRIAGLDSIIISEFSKAYENGGILCLEEIDAAHPTVLTAINNAIAGDTFWNDVEGRAIPRHADFRLIATGNTTGNGPTPEFPGRLPLDGATKDRFAAGMVEVLRDARLEDAIIEKMIVASEATA